MNRNGSSPEDISACEETRLSHTVKALLDEQGMTPEEEMQALLRAKRESVRRARISALRLAVGMSVVVAALVLWYASVPVPAGIYPAKVLGGAYSSPDLGEGVRFPVMWVKAYPFQLRPPALDQLLLQDAEGKTVAVAEATAISLDAAAPLARRVKGWITVRPVPVGGTACTALIRTARGSEKAFDIGVLHFFGEPGRPNSPIAALDDVSLVFPDLGPQGRMWLTVSLAANVKGATLQAAKTGEVVWLGSLNADLFHFVSVPIMSEPVSEGTRVIVSGFEFLDWRSCELPLPLQEAKSTRLAVRLAAWAGTLATDFFMYVPVELEVEAGNQRHTIRGTALDERQERPWEMYQTTPRPELRVRI